MKTQHETNITYEMMSNLFSQYEKHLDDGNKLKKYTFISPIDDSVNAQKSSDKKIVHKPQEKIKIFKIDFEGENAPRNYMEDKIMKAFNLDRLKNLSPAMLLE